jgi:hypothetical protein
VHVRVEGLRATLFDRVVLSDGHDVRASSDVASRRCDGTNGGAHPDAGPTATAATADALATRGETFDGTWNAGYEDYFMRRLGPEAEDDGLLRWWGLLVDGASAGAGGCQTRVGAGDEVLWANDAFSARPFLRLAAAGAQPIVPVGDPLAVGVTASDGSGAGAAPYAGARVEAVDVDGRPVAAGVADGAVSAADGSAAIVFHAVGWQRVKARGPMAAGDPDALPAAIASNSVDVCVEPAPGAGCAGTPPSQAPLVPPAPAPPATGSSAAPPPGTPPSSPPPTAPGPGPAASASACSAAAGDAPHARARSRAPRRLAAVAGDALHARARPRASRRLAAGARLRMRCPAGRPALVVRSLSRHAAIELRVGGRRARVALTRRAGPRVVRALRLRRAGIVELRVLRGVVHVALASRARATSSAAAPRAGGSRARPAVAAATRDDRLDLTIRFLQDVQNPDGGFGGTRGAPSDPTFSAWVALALAAGGINPRDQARPGGADAYAYLTAHAAMLSATTDFERAALVAVAAGASPRGFGGVDLVAAILARQLPSGAFTGQAGGTTGYVNATAFALLPLSALHEPALEPALRRGAGWLLSVQEPDGAWGFAPSREPSSDTTAAVLQALRAIGRGGTPQEARAWEYLRGLRNPDGGYGFGVAHPESNTASTAWVAQAMWAAGVDPAAAPPGGGPSALDHLAAMQRPDGSIAWKAGADANGVWMAAYAAPAYAGRPLPIAAVPRAVPVAPPASSGSPATPPATGRARRSGAGSLGRAGSGVAIAGGGGNGAPLFSRPQPQSRGRVAGGVRDQAARHRPTRRRAAGRAGPSSAVGGRSARGGPAPGRALVTGLVLEGGGRAAVAPSLDAARAGGRPPGPALALALTAALALCGALGAAGEARAAPLAAPEAFA